jgi:hypothetical protein
VGKEPTIFDRDDCMKQMGRNSSEGHDEAVLIVDWTKEVSI